MKIRINQDVTFNWKLTVGGESVDLSKLELSVEITTPSNKKVEITPNIQFDTLEFNYRPKQVGEYILSAYLNRFKDGETALDIKAFEGVKYSWNQDFSTDDTLEANYVELAGDFNFGPNAPSAPDVPSVDLSRYAEKSYVDTQINDEATARTQADSELQSKINTKQDTLTAGENIKIENNVISAIDLRPSVDLSDYAKTTYVDTQINNEATARTQSDSELQSKINTKQDKIIAGTGINITDNTISCTLDTTIFKVVDSLPAAPLSGDENKIHLVLSTNSEEGNTYDEYLWVNNSWEKIGSYIPSVDLSDYATTAYVDTKASYIDTQINNEATARTQADSELQSKINSKQDTLTAGENIKIENNVISVIDLSPSVDLSDYAKTTYVDTQISTETTARTQADSELQTKINTKQDKIIAGTGIDITDNTISCTLDTTIFKVVDSLPATPPSSDKNKIHLVLSSISGESNSYDEYLWVNNSWEKIGTFIPSVDLSDYATTSYVDTQIHVESIIRSQTDSELQSKINSKQDTLTAGDNIKIENNVISAIGGGTTGATELSVKITWAELKALVDNSKLVVGQQYRITDYTCTTTQAATKSAGHVFDIIVTADSTNVLNEEARAIKHDEDTYFTDCDFNAWKIWYCIDNDTNRFAWADSANGKGVIYRMIDEFNNDCPYDFKNIQFYRQWAEAKQLWCTIQTDNTGVPCYTFSSDGSSSTTSFTDMSLSASNAVYSNVIRQFIKDNKQTLNNICFFGTICNKNTFGADCRENTFGNKCSSNAFGSYCFLNSFGNECNYNSFGPEFNQNSFGSGCSYNLFGSGCYINAFDNRCYLNSFGGGCHNNSFSTGCYLNSFGSGFHDNSFGSDCDRNSFGSDCNNISFGNNCDYNSFGNNCYSNSFRSNCNSNSFGNNCYSNSFVNECNSNLFGNNCYSNSFGSNCYSNSFGDGCNRSSFGNSCSYNSFGNSCNYIRFASSANASNKYSFYSNNHFGDSCSFILFKGAETASVASQVQNYNFAQGLRGTGNAYITIDGKRGRAYETKVAKNSSGTLKIYCEADSIQ